MNNQVMKINKFRTDFLKSTQWFYVYGKMQPLNIMWLSYSIAKMMNIQTIGCVEPCLEGLKIVIHCKDAKQNSVSVSRSHSDKQIDECVGLICF